MSEQLIISISGMRGIVGENLTGFIAAEYGCAFGSFLKDRNGGKKGKVSVCVGRDSQTERRYAAIRCDRRAVRRRRRCY